MLPTLTVGSLVLPLACLLGQLGASSNAKNNHNLADQCADCRILGDNIQSLVRRPVQVDAYGQVPERVDLDKLKKTVCKDILDDSLRERCRSFYFGQQSSVLKWHQTPRSRASFFDFVCIKELKLCCPPESFGPKCTKCKPCKPNEQCDGEGTRSGAGNCVCKPGHTGANCSACQPGYYRDKAKRFSTSSAAAARNDTLVCKPCHRSCVYCRHEGSLGCEVCRPGFRWLAEFGCSDIDECTSQSGICGENTFCVNTEGSFFCYQCDRACDGCHGDGPDMCLRCAKGYKLDQGNCVATRKTILPPEANYYRYGIYLGLCVCTCIILHNSVYLAGFIGLSVALYIGLSEYVMSGHEAEIARSAGQRQASQWFGDGGFRGHPSPVAHLGL